MIKLENLRKSFNGRPVLRDLSFEARDGAITGLLGANGAGKTTTLRAICGVLQPESGSVTIDQETAETGSPQMQQGVGALLDHIGLYARLTVRENLEYFGRLRGMNGQALRRSIDRVISILGLETIADRPTAGFSQGERMKTALGRAILHSPKNLLLDEPTNGLDVLTIRSLREMLKRLRDEGTCVHFLQPRPRRSAGFVRHRRRDFARKNRGPGVGDRTLLADIHWLPGRCVRTTDIRTRGLNMNHVLTIARKEIVDGARDFRSLLAAFFYAIMGPLVVGLVSLAVSGTSTSGATVLTSMMAVFTLVSAFVGGMNVAMDTVAGERERRSLLPLLLTGVPREEIMLGKWLAVSFFALAGLLVDLLGFAIVFALTGIHSPALSWSSLVLLAFGLLSLPLLAAAMQLLISTASHAIKEAQTYLSLVVFAPMGIGMFMIFSPAARHAWLGYLPMVGQQLQLEAWVNGQPIGLWQPVALGYLTMALTFLALMAATNRLRRDEVLYGN